MVGRKSYGPSPQDHTLKGCVEIAWMTGVTFCNVLTSEHTNEVVTGPAFSFLRDLFVTFELAI